MSASLAVFLTVFLFHCMSLTRVLFTFSRSLSSLTHCLSLCATHCLSFTVSFLCVADGAARLKGFKHLRLVGHSKYRGGFGLDFLLFSDLILGDRTDSRIHLDGADRVARRYGRLAHV